MIEGMVIGELAASSGLSVRMLRFYADAGVLPESGRTDEGYRVFGPDAVARARPVRALRELGVGLHDIKAVLAAETSLVDVAAEHARALDAQIAMLRLRRAVLRAVIGSTDPKGFRRVSLGVASPGGGGVRLRRRRLKRRLVREDRRVRCRVRVVRRCRRRGSLSRIP